MNFLILILKMLFLIFGSCIALLFLGVLTLYWLVKFAFWLIKAL